MLTMSLTTSLVIIWVFAILGHNDKGVNDKSHCCPFLMSVCSNKVENLCVYVCVCLCWLCSDEYSIDSLKYSKYLCCVCYLFVEKNKTIIHVLYDIVHIHKFC